MPRQTNRDDQQTGFHPSMAKIFTVCLLAVAILFLGYEIVERTWLQGVDPKVLYVLHIARGLSAAAIAATLASILVLRQLYDQAREEGSLPASTGRWQRRLQHVHMRTKIVVPLVLLAVAPATIVGLFAISSVRASLRTTAIQRVEFDAAAKAQAIRDFLATIRSDVSFLAHVDPIRELAVAESAGEADRLQSARYAAEQELVVFVQGKSAYYQVRYLNKLGREVIRLNIEGDRIERVLLDELQDKSDRYYVREALALDPGQVYVSRMDLNVEHGQVELPHRGVVRYASRVVGIDGELGGLVIVNLYADYVLSLLAPLMPGVEAWLVNGDGAYLGYLGESAEKHNAFSLRVGRELAADFNAEQVSAILEGGADESLLETANTLLSFAPIALDGGVPDPRWTLLIAYQSSPIYTPIRQLTVFLVVLAAFVVVVAGLIGVFVGSYLARPIASLRRATREIASGDLSKRVHVTTGDELEGLASDFNSMTDKLRSAQERLSAWNVALEQEVRRQTDELHELHAGLSRADKMASIGQMTAGVMHEVGNPLAAIKTKIQVAEERGALGKNCQVILSEILFEVDRLTLFLRAFSRLAKPREVQLEKVAVTEVIQGVVSLITPELRRRSLRLRVELAPDTPAICGDGEQLRQLLINLILNAADASGPAGEIVLRTGCASEEPEPATLARRAAVEVEDEGAGIAQEDLERIWDPFFTTKPEGTGLGLSICRKIVADHGGTVQVRSKPGHGTVIALTIPCWEAGIDGTPLGDDRT